MLLAALPRICRDPHIPIVERGLIIFILAFLPLLFVVEVLFALPFLYVQGELIWLGLIAGNILLPMLGLLFLAFNDLRAGLFFRALPLYMLHVLAMAAPMVADIVLPLVRQFTYFSPVTWELCSEAGLCWVLTLGVGVLVLDGWRRFVACPERDQQAPGAPAMK